MPVLSGSCFTWAWGNLVGVGCCPLPAGGGREDGIRGAQVPSGLTQAQSLVPWLLYTQRKGSGPNRQEAPRSTGCWSAVLPADEITCDVYPYVAILQVIIIAKLCQSCPGLGPPGGGERVAGEGAWAGTGALHFHHQLSQSICGAAA